MLEKQRKKKLKVTAEVTPHHLFLTFNRHVSGGWVKHTSANLSKLSAMAGRRYLAVVPVQDAQATGTGFRSAEVAEVLDRPRGLAPAEDHGGA